MRLNRLVLHDFGLYRGEQEIQLAPREKHGAVRPVVLVGGHNGAGKTTILEAIRLCLYGRLALGQRVREQEYLDYLRERVHKDRDALLQANAASVAIDFDYARGAKRQSFFVKRSWTVVGGKVTESLAVWLDGKTLDEVDSEFWPDFLRSLVPPGLSQLFFFDGEKIQKLAEDASDAEALAESVKALLGLDIVERLQADLDLYLSRMLRKGTGSGQASRLPELEREVQAQETLVGGLVKEEAELRNKWEHAAREVERIEHLLAEGGYGLAGKRQELLQRKARLTARAEEIGKGVRDLLDGPLPVAACPKLSRRLLTQMQMEAAADHWRGARKEVDRVLDLVARRVLATSRKQKVKSSTRESLEEVLEAIRRNETSEPKELVGFVSVHGLSGREREECQRAIGLALGGARLSAKRACTDLLKVEQQLRVLQERLAKSPEADEIAPQIRALSTLHDAESDAKAHHVKCEATKGEAEKKLAALQRERKRLLESLASSGKADQRIDLAHKTRQVLGKYLERLTLEKVKQLEVTTMACFAELSRKEDLVSAISINPVSFKVELIDRNGQKIPKSSLSAGEKQIYAISVLWGLAKVSGRPLPMIIDTPLGRLDSVHRGKLIDRYFPKAAHQVVVLSTDTEIDAEFFESLRPHMSHAVHLVHDRSGWTQAQPGYFWKEAEGGAVANKAGNV